MILFTTDTVLAAQASTDPRNRVVLVTEHAPAVLLQNPNIVKLPVLLPPFAVVSTYVDYGEDKQFELPLVRSLYHHGCYVHHPHHK